MSHHNEILSALAAAAQTPRIPFFGQLAAGLVAAGFTLIPQDLWDVLAQKVLADELSDVRDGQQYYGFLVRDNHTRSEQHEYWQTTILPKSQETVWVIPVEEFICLSYGEMDACDFVNITRLIFVGTEEQLRAAVASLPDPEDEDED
jgi:hypothetical protein